jgi:ATP-binding cassette, subfamily B, bacterial
MAKSTIKKPTSLRTSLPGLRRTIRAFWPYLRKERSLVVGSLVALLAETLLRLAEPWPLKFIFDRVLVQSAVPAFGLMGSQLLLAAVIAVVVFTGFRALAAYFSTVGFSLVGNRVLTSVRSELYRHLQRLSLSYHSKSKQGDTVMRVMSDVGMLKEVAVTALLPLVGDVLVFVGMLLVMFFLDWRLALISLALFPLFYLTSLRLGKRIQEVSRKQRKREGAMVATATEALGAMKTVQALALEDRFAEAFTSQNNKSLKDGVRGSRLAASLERSVDLLIAVVTALVLYFGARYVLAQQLTPGDLLVFLSYLRNAFKPVRDMAKYTARLAKASAAGERILEILAEKPDIQDGYIPAPTLRGEVRFENVSLAYEEGREALRNVTVDIKAGQRVALVGSSGSGKSSLVSLLPRLYDPQQGRVLLDDVDSRHYTLQSLRSQISTVLQDGVTFGMSIWDNIALAAPDSSNEAILQAAKLAQLDEFVQRLPEGYNTMIGERGVMLSGGQRQRIAIARAALRQTPLLILDEPTVGLDEHNERLVLQALENVSEQRTTFLVTHDLRLASQMDKILYLEAGVLLEQGTHDELLELAGRYASLYKLQLTPREKADYALLS